MLDAKLMVTGIDYKSETGTYNDLTETVATELSKSGVAISASELAACHRNGNKIKSIARKGSSIKDVLKSGGRGSRRSGNMRTCGEGIKQKWTSTYGSKFKHLIAQSR